MKTAEEYALEEWTDGDGGYSPYEIAKMAFDAGLAEGKSIWKKPDERPTKYKVKNYGILPYTEIITVTKDRQTRDVRYYHYPSGPRNIGGEVTHWCYTEDFLNVILPDWATTEVGE